MSSNYNKTYLDNLMSGSKRNKPLFVNVAYSLMVFYTIMWIFYQNNTILKNNFLNNTYWTLFTKLRPFTVHDQNSTSGKQNSQFKFYNFEIYIQSEFYVLGTEFWDFFFLSFIFYFVLKYKIFNLCVTFLFYKT